MTYFQTHIKKHKIIAYSNNAFSYRCGFLRQGAFLVPANLRHQELPRSSRLQNIAISVEPHSSMYDPVTSVTRKHCSGFSNATDAPCASSMQRTTTSQNQEQSHQTLQGIFFKESLSLRRRHNTVAAIFLQPHTLRRITEICMT